MKRTYPIGMLLVFLSIFILKAFLAFQAIAHTKGNFGYDQGIWFFTQDAPAIGLYALFLLLISTIPWKICRSGLILIGLLAIVIAALDTVLLVTLNAHLVLSDILKFLPAWRMTLPFLGIKSLFGIVACCLLLSTRIQLSRCFAASVSIFSFTLIAALPLYAPPPGSSLEVIIRRYSIFKAIQGTRILPPPGPIRSYTKQFAQEAYQEFNKRTTLSLPQSGTDVILLMVESLSAVDSIVTGGDFNRLPHLERIAKDGILFSNFLANYRSTEGGLVSLLNGAPPVPFPGGTSSVHRSFILHNSVIRAFKNLGYYTEFLTNYYPNNLEQDIYCRGVGFDAILGAEDLDIFKSAPHTGSDAPPDEYLYAAFKERWAALTDVKQPKFFHLTTISSHTPLTNPRDPKMPITEDQLWQYVDTEIGKFYDWLKEIAFFEHGILIILGDHRKWEIYTESEFDRYGYRSMARIPLVIVGKGVPRIKNDTRLWSQSDLFSQLNKALTSSEPLASEVIFVEPDSISFDYGVPSAEFRIFTDKEDYAGNIYGSELSWQEVPLKDSERIAKRIHIQRAAFQNERGNESSCTFVPDKSYKQPNMVSILQFNGNTIAKPLPNSSPIYASQLKEFPFVWDTTVLPKLQKVTSIYLSGTLIVTEPGEYWFRVGSDNLACLGIDHSSVVDANYSHLSYSTHENGIYLSKGRHIVELRYLQEDNIPQLRLEWNTPLDRSWKPIPSTAWSGGNDSY